MLKARRIERKARGRSQGKVKEGKGAFKDEKYEEKKKEKKKKKRKGEVSEKKRSRRKRKE